MSRKRTEKRRRRTTNKKRRGGYRRRTNTNKIRWRVDTPMTKFIEDKFDEKVPSSKRKYKVPMEKRFIYEER